jgi:hypothetical protein
VFPSSIPVETLDPDRSPSDGRRVLAVEKVNILSASATIFGDRVVISRFTFEMSPAEHHGYVVNVVCNAMRPRRLQGD